MANFDWNEFRFKSFDEYQYDLNRVVVEILKTKPTLKSLQHLSLEKQAEIIIKEVIKNPISRGEIHLQMNSYDDSEDPYLKLMLDRILSPYLNYLIAQEQSLEKESSLYLDSFAAIASDLEQEFDVKLQELTTQQQQEAKDLAKYLKLERVLLDIFGESLAELVEARNTLCRSKGFDQLIKEFEQYSVNQKSDQIVLHITWASKNKFINLCDAIINSKDISSDEKTVITDLKNKIVHIIGNYKLTPEQQEAQLKELFADKGFKKALSTCDKGIISKFLDLCLMIVTLGLVKPTVSATQQFDVASKGLFVLYDNLSSTKDGIEIGAASQESPKTAAPAA